MSQPPQNVPAGPPDFGMADQRVCSDCFTSPCECGDVPCRLLCADPPWMFGDKLPGPSRGAEKNYACLTVADICAFPLPVLADDGILLLWRVSAMVEEAMRVVRAWGFEPKSEIVWVKTKKDGDVDAPEPPLSFGMGRYVRASHETCIVAARGRAASLVEDRAVRSVFYAPRGEHSEKPAAFYALAERLVKTGKRVELFARRVRPGWEGYGDQLPGRPAHPAQRAA